MPTLPILPGPVVPGVFQPASPTAAAASATDPTADASADGSFLDQLAAALASLAPVEPGQPELEGPQDDSANDDKNEDTQTADQTMAELAASFGLVPMPLLTPLAPVNSAPVQPTTSDHANETATVTAQPPMTQAAMLPLVARQMASGAAAAQSSTADAAQTGQPESQAAQATPVDPEAEQSTPSLPTDSDAAAHATTHLAPAAVHVAAEAALGALSPNLPTPGLEHPSALAGQPPRQADSNEASSPRSETRPTAAGAPADSAALAAVAPQHGVSAHRGTDVREPTTAVPAVLASTSDQHVQRASAGAQTHGGYAEQHASAKAEAATPTPPVDAADPTAQAVPFSAALAGTAVNQSNTLDAPQPREVVAQIAQQAELYRLPGGRGVRIQLHPEGLGGVEVTVRYGSAGALELHVNVEHAATGDLVQAGWAELRDALSQQGISPDRLVMSVSGPQGGGLSSDSGGFGSGAGFRADAGAMGFGQSASQGQQERQPAPSRSRWAPSLETTPQEENVAPISSSRIDLRV